MSTTMEETRTYRGATLEELLPQIRAELGDGAVVTRRREGVVGGFGGFFGKRCVEVEARGTPAPPSGALIDAYDAGDDEDEDAGPLMEAVLRQSAPFAEQSFQGRLAAAAHELAAVEDAPTLEFSMPAPQPPPAEAPAPAAAPAPAPAAADEVVVEGRLLRAGLAPKLVRSLIAHVEAHVAPFAPATPLRDHVRAALAERIEVRTGWRTKRRTIALVGLPGTGRTATAAGIARAYAAAGRSVAALSLEGVRESFELAQLTEGLGVEFAVAASPTDVANTARRLNDHELLVVDTPAFVPGDDAAARELARAVAAAHPDEIHLVVPGATSCESATRVLESLAAAGIEVDRLLVTRLDERRDAAGLVGASLAARIPFSYLADGALRPADAAVLAELVL